MIVDMQSRATHSDGTKKPVYDRVRVINPDDYEKMLRTAFATANDDEYSDFVGVEESDFSPEYVTLKNLYHDTSEYADNYDEDMRRIQDLGVAITGVRYADGTIDVEWKVNEQ